MQLVLEEMDFLKLTSTNHKLHLATMRLHIWPFVLVDILLLPELFVMSQAITHLYHTLLNLYHGIPLLYVFIHNQSELKGP